MSRGILTAAAGLAAAAFMLYFPYTWCRLKGEDERDFGLKWFMRLAP